MTWKRVPTHHECGTGTLKAGLLVTRTREIEEDSDTPKNGLFGYCTEMFCCCSYCFFSNRALAGFNPTEECIVWKLSSQGPQQLSMRRFLQPLWHLPNSNQQPKPAGIITVHYCGCAYYQYFGNSYRLFKLCTKKLIVICERNCHTTTCKCISSSNTIA